MSGMEIRTLAHGAESIVSKMKAEQARIAREKNQAEYAAARVFLAATKAEAPAGKTHKRASGKRLRATIHIERNKRGEGLVVKPGNLSHLVVPGQVAHEESPKSKRAMHWGGKKGPFVMRVHHPAVPPNPFVERAYKAARADAIRAARMRLFPKSTL